jgi:formate-dependent nitrite reductase membrane component NrfD
MQACPYDAIHIDPYDKTVSKCNYCAHRVEIGLEPPCVNICPTHAIISGDKDDSQNEIAELLSQNPVQVRKPEKGTDPKLYYIHGDEASLSPGATSGGEYMWSDLPPVGVDTEAWRTALERQAAELGEPAYQMKQVKARKVYASAEPHRGSWARSVSSHLITKSIASGLMLVMAPLVMFGSRVSPEGLVPTTLVSMLFLGITLALLVYKLERPERFLRVMTRPQWRSWLTRGGYTMFVYSILLTLVFLFALFRGRPPNSLLSLTAVVGAAVALYSAFLFNQAKGRDLWQSPVLPLHRLAHAVVAGAATLILLSQITSSMNGLEPILVRVFAAGLALNLLALGAEFNSRHPTEDGEAAARFIITGRFRVHFWLGVFILGNLVPVVLLTQGWVAPSAILALLGLAIFDEVFVRAGQSISLS